MKDESKKNGSELPTVFAGAKATDKLTETKVEPTKADNRTLGIEYYEHKAEKATKMLEKAKKALEDASQTGRPQSFAKRKAWQANQMANQFERQSKGKFQKGKGKGKSWY